MRLIAGARRCRGRTVEFTGFGGDRCAARPRASRAWPWRLRGDARHSRRREADRGLLRNGRRACGYVFDPDVPFGLPFRPTPFTATFTLTVGGLEFTYHLPGPGALGRRHLQRREAQPSCTSCPRSRSTHRRRDRGRLTRRRRRCAARRTCASRSPITRKGAATADVALQLPQGWRATPANADRQLHARRRADDGAVRVDSRRRRRRWRPRRSRAATSSRSRPRHRRRATYAQGYQVVEYPHTTRRHVLSTPSVTREGARRQREAEPHRRLRRWASATRCPRRSSSSASTVTMLTRSELAWGDLSKYDVIMTGVRAYERRARSARLQPAAARLRRGRRHGDRPVQQVRVQRRAVRPVSRQGRPRARDRRERAR